MRAVAHLLITLLISPTTAIAEAVSWPDLPSREACEAVLTVVKEDCSVEHVFRCEGGVQRSEQRGLGDAAYSVTHMRSPLTDWTFRADDGFAILAPDIAPMIHLDDLAAGTLQTQTGTVFMWVPPFSYPFKGRYDSQWAIADRDVDIDGIRLLRLKKTQSASFNSGQLSFSGWDDIYVAPGLGLSFLGSNEFVTFGVAERYNSSPVQLIRPGEPGFLADPEAAACNLAGRVTDTARSFGGKNA